MAYRREKEKPLGEILIHDLITLPWWASLVFGVIVWGMVSVATTLWPRNFVVMLIQGLMPILPFFVAAMALLSAFKAWKDKSSLGRVRSLQDMKAVSWQQFESLAAAYYRERGYAVKHTGQAGPDGGIDLKLYSNSKLTIVQCKRYGSMSVGVQAIREFFGVVVASGAEKGIFITTSSFTPEAMTFGLSQACLELIPGDRFAQMVKHLHSGISPHLDEPAAPPACPRCASPMMLRKAARGPQSGTPFWGCSAFPACRGTRPQE